MGDTQTISIKNTVKMAINFAILSLCTFTSFAQNINDEPVRPIPTTIELDAAKVALGEKLFHETALSGNGQISCASCHSLDKGGTDQLPVSIGVSGNPGAVNAPTVFNVGNHFMFFWDGRAQTLEEQIDGPIHNPDEMATDWTTIIANLQKNESYLRDFREVYQSIPSEQNIKDAIATFERSLATPNAPFDQYLKGNEAAISVLAKEGYSLFKAYGCAACHQGQNLGGNMFQQFGVIGDYFSERGTPLTPADLGRYNVTKDDWDKYFFKVPTLRNIALTAPYFHDGSAGTLEEAVEIMARYQLGKELSELEKEAIIAFLHSLTGEYDGKALK